MDHDDNRRVAGKENGVVTRRYFWDGQLKIVAELDGSGNLVSQFVYGAHVNVPEYMVKGGATYRLITDQLGSVRLVVNTSTGAVAQRIEYDEFGVVTNDTNPGFQPFGFAGGLYDPDTKLTRFGARDYDAETGRWTSKDPIGFDGYDVNIYGYALSDPVNINDYNGMTPVWFKKYGGLFCNYDWAYEADYCDLARELADRAPKRPKKPEQGPVNICPEPASNPKEPGLPPDWLWDVLDKFPRTITPLDFDWIMKRWKDSLDKLPRTDY